MKKSYLRPLFASFLAWSSGHNAGPFLWDSWWKKHHWDRSSVSISLPMRHFPPTFHMHTYLRTNGARGYTVCWGIVLQAGRSWVCFAMLSLEFFIE
jgi:hypothetical protein